MHRLTATLALLALLTILPTVAAAQTPAPLSADATRDLNLSAYTQLLRSDIRAQKSAVISEVMQFTPAEGEVFWPIYREYEAELAKANDDRIALISEYTSKYSTLTDEVADRLARRALELETQRQALKVRYYDRLQKALSAKTAARFIQVENQILLLLDLQIAASLPIVE